MNLVYYPQSNSATAITIACNFFQSVLSSIKINEKPYLSHSFVSDIEKLASFESVNILNS